MPLLCDQTCNFLSTFMVIYRDLGATLELIESLLSSLSAMKRSLEDLLRLLRYQMGPKEITETERDR